MDCLLFGGGGGGGGGERGCLDFACSWFKFG